MNTKEQIRELEQQKRKEITSVAHKYRVKIELLHAKCDHKYGEWFMRFGTVIPDTNIFGEQFEHKKCEYCGHELTRVHAP